MNFEKEKKKHVFSQITIFSATVQNILRMITKTKKFEISSLTSLLLRADEFLSILSFL